MTDVVRMINPSKNPEWIVEHNSNSVTRARRPTTGVCAPLILMIDGAGVVSHKHRNHKEGMVMENNQPPDQQWECAICPKVTWTAVMYLSNFTHLCTSTTLGVYMSTSNSPQTPWDLWKHNWGITCTCNQHRGDSYAHDSYTRDRALIFYVLCKHMEL